MLGLEYLVAECAPEVAPQTMLAIINVESKGNPWAIGNNTLKQAVTPVPKTKLEAIKIANYYLSLGHSLDIGLSQINSANIRKLGLTVEQVFDPCVNVKVGADILKTAYLQASSVFGEGQKALMHALSAYNTGSLYRGQAYVNRIIKAANVTIDKDNYKLTRLEVGRSPRRVQKAESSVNIQSDIKKYNEKNSDGILIDENGYGILVK